MKAIVNAKEKILDAAGNLLTKQGLPGFNIRKIAKTAGVSVGSVYNFYPSKSELVFEIMGNLLGGCVAVLGNTHGKTIYEEFKAIYFQMLNYYSLFESNLMADLMILASSEGNSKANVEFRHMNIFHEAFEKVFAQHKDEIDPKIFSVLGADNTIEIILFNFNDMLRRNVKDFTKIEFVLRKLLQK